MRCRPIYRRQSAQLHSPLSRFHRSFLFPEIYIHHYIYLFHMAEIINGHGVDSEIGNVSARQAALKRWTAADKRSNKNAVFRGSVVAFRYAPGTSDY